MRKGTLLTVIIIIAVSGIFASCIPPGTWVRSSDGSSGITVDYDSFWVVPRRLVYNIFDYFVRDKDLYVFAAEEGVVKPVDVNDVEISMITNPDAEPENQKAPVLINNGERWLDINIGKGRKLVIITYGELKTEYSVEVIDPKGLIIDGPSGNNGGYPPVDIEWAKPDN